MTDSQTDTPTEPPDTYPPEQIKKLTHGILGRAVTLNASSVLLEPGDDGLQVSFENPSGKHLTPPLPSQVTGPLLDSFKTLAGIDTSTGRCMGSGRFKLRIDGGLFNIKIVCLALHDKEVMGISLSEASQPTRSITPPPRRTGILKWFKPEKKG